VNRLKEAFRNFSLKFFACCWTWGNLLAVPNLMSESYGFAAPTASLAIAQSDNPLLFDRQDPIIPMGYGKRELSSFEKYRLEKAIAKLDRDAQNELEQNRVDAAMELWYRRLRLTRLIDTEVEIEALGKVGAIAWSENRSLDVRNIANRLMAIQTESTDSKRSLLLLAPLAIAYEQVRYLDRAAAIYQQILATEKTPQAKTLEKLGQLYLGIFDYDRAAAIYQQILGQKTSTQQQEPILKTLIEIYHHTKQISQAIAAQEQLIQQYFQNQKNNQIPALEIAIARDYQALKQTNKALEAYNRAFEEASATKQLAIASDALIGKVSLYQQQGNLEQAINTYNKLLVIQQQAYNYYGLVNTYDSLGKISLKLNQNKKAKDFFQLGLSIAEKLDYKAKYFRDRLKSLPI
jgi:tetratricopeptide (TPR) repeat protein